jgi:hypothetical protein
MDPKRRFVMRDACIDGDDRFPRAAQFAAPDRVNGQFFTASS